MGGLVVQLLVNRGLGAAGVAIDSAPPQSVFSAEWSFLESDWPMITPFGDQHEPRLIPFDDFAYAFANTLQPETQHAFYDRHIVPESHGVPRESLTHVAHIDFDREHAPLLLVAGSEDHIIPAGLNESNYRKYGHAPGSVSDFKEFAGRDHLTIVEDGWETVAAWVSAWLRDQEVWLGDAFDRAHARGTAPRLRTRPATRIADEWRPSPPGCLPRDRRLYCRPDILVRADQRATA